MADPLRWIFQWRGRGGLARFGTFRSWFTRTRPASSAWVNVSLALVLSLGGCDTLWPTEGEYDPARYTCPDACASGSLCYRGTCIDAGPSSLVCNYNDKAQGVEACDGSDLKGKTCASFGFKGGTLACVNCLFDTTSCHRCGNSVLDLGEQCDGSNLFGATCETLGYDSGTLTCSAACRFNTEKCISYLCNNDGKLDLREACDGLNLNGATCSSLGFFGGTLVCVNCSYDTQGCHFCGNGILDFGEQCDGSTIPDTCTSLMGKLGKLTCSKTCTYNISQCKPVPMDAGLGLDVGFKKEAGPDVTVDK